MIYLPWMAPLERHSEMKGSDKWGQGGGPSIRIEIILAALVAVTLVGVYFFFVQNSRLSSSQTGGVTTVSTTGVNCDSDSMPETAQQVQNNASFEALTGNLCYNFMGENSSESAALLYFDYFNGTIVYPCGDAPQDLITSQIQAAVSSSGHVISVQMGNQSSLNAPQKCGPEAPLVGVVSVEDVESTIPAVPQLNVTIAATPGARTVATLSATLTLDGGTQRFQLVAPPSTLAPGRSVSKTEIILSGISFSADGLYPMTISGTFDNGQSFDYLVHVQIARVP